MDARITLALAVVRQQYPQKLTVRCMAHQLGLSESRFAHLFAKDTCTTFKRLLQDVRFTTARKLLENRALSVKQVSFSVGYLCVSTFCREFKLKHGKTPSQFRADILLLVERPTADPNPPLSC